MAFSPVSASEQITNKYKRYLKTIFSINDTELSRQFTERLDEPGVFSKGPYLEVNASFEKGASIDQMIFNGKLAKSFGRINMPLSRQLHKHQEIAIEKAMSGRNIVVSTGTGSGKTEAFLIPILEVIIREYEAKTLRPGVRALLIYPMNALANDQTERLRELLSDFPEITFGSYTGQTKQKPQDALNEYKALNENKDPLPNELISREQIKQTPPHILITNYAMLEYLLVRPDDGIFFAGEYAHLWKYIVLDEAHVYHGSSGIEVSMLLRRLKTTLGNDDIQYVLTSATLGKDNSNTEVAEFAENLCGSPFDASDVVRAHRIKPVPSGEVFSLPADFYKKVVNTINEGNGEPSLSPETLYDRILHDSNYNLIYSHLDMPRTLSELSDIVGWSVDQLADFVAVASKAEKEGVRLFDSKYHMFLRATESVFITLGDDRKLFLTRKKMHYEPDGREYHVFEIATCSVCHSIYIVGAEKEGFLVQSSFNTADDLRSVFFLGDAISDTDDDHLLEDENVETEDYEVCARCGFLRRAGRGSRGYCDHGKESFYKLIKVNLNEDSETLTKCVSCENTNSFGILRMFFTGQEAVTSVIGTALFEELPSYTIKKTTIDANDDDSGFSLPAQTTIEEGIRQAKQFIAFSDSRQAAAFYATYFDQSYRTILYSRLIVETLTKLKTGENGKPVDQFVDDLITQFDRHGIANDNPNNCRKEAWKAILHELVDNNGTTSLSNMGLIGISLSSDNMPENRDHGLSAEEVCGLCSVFALGMMADAAIIYNCSLNQADKEFFAHKGIECSYTLSDPSNSIRRKAFVPRFVDRSNKRADYLQRVLARSGLAYDNEKTNKLLESFWTRIFVAGELVAYIDGAYKLQSQKIIISSPRKWYICPVCKKKTFINVKGVCPSYKCRGVLEDIDMPSVMKENHYYQMYQSLDIRELTVAEHTAQLNREKAYEYQKQFKQKYIDVLSCSTTFEMGVDVGTLETVFMRNMPPSPANYAQRAGRAGRSKHTAAFALTFCNKSSHDFSFFTSPLRMIKGRIDPPKFVVENEKIAIRHVYASALSFFWRRNPSLFSKVSQMTEAGTDPGSKSGAEEFCRYLRTQPADLKEYIRRFLPPALLEKYSVDTYGWLNGIIGEDSENPGVLTKAVAEYEYEVGILNSAIEEAIRNKHNVDRLMSRVRVYQNEDILSFLSRKNVLPKYGFPVDSVEMSVSSTSETGRLGLQLSRDLSLAISEYAPGSQIVANGNLITSRYIRKIPKMGWKMYDYILCNKCNTLNLVPHTGNDCPEQLNSCRACTAELHPTSKKVFIVPAFGFEADSDKITKPGLRKPERTYRGEVSYVGNRKDTTWQKYQIGKGKLEVLLNNSDEMAVINHSNFFVCESCGFTDLDEKTFTRSKNKKHKNSAGYPCFNDGTNKLSRYSLGYRFETDVLLVRFLQPEIDERNLALALSLLYGILKGICGCLNIEESDISGCVQFFHNESTNRPNYSLVLYDVTPGGAGHIKRLSGESIFRQVLVETKRLMDECTCGGEDKDSSCYTCLRSYYNQRYHDSLSRKYILDFIDQIL